jgi:hypothetical protein
MSETDQPVTQKQNSLIWQGLQIVRKPPEWIKAARDSGRVDVALILHVDQVLSRR